MLVYEVRDTSHRRDTEDTEGAQRNTLCNLCVLCVSAVNLLAFPHTQSVLRMTICA